MSNQHLGLYKGPSFLQGVVAFIRGRKKLILMTINTSGKIFKKRGGCGYLLGGKVTD